MRERTITRSHQFETLMLPHLDALYRTAYHLTRSPEEAEDLTQETYLRAYRAFDTCRGDNVKAWLFAILRHIFLDAYRRQQRSPILVDLEALETATDNLTEEGFLDTHAVEDHFLAGLIDEDVERALASLPATWRLVILLADVEDFSYQEIADITQTPIGTVMSRLHRARRRLADHLRAVAPTAGWGTEQEG